MAGDVSVTDRKLASLILAILQMSLPLARVQAATFSTGPYLAATDLYSSNNNNETCPDECRCFKVNETNLRWMRRLECTVSHISPHLTSLVFQVSSPATGYLYFRCPSTQGSQFESRLWDGAFQKLSHLRELHFDGCQFRAFSKHALRGLNSLTKLAVRGAIIDNLDPDLLVYLPHLVTLEVSYSSLTHFPRLCSASFLTAVNISGNRIKSLEDAGLHCPDNPLHQLTVLDVSNNLLKDIPPWLDQILPSLQHLELANNLISDCQPSPFEYLKQLTYLDISNNSLTSFTPALLKGCSRILFLNLSGNKISSLPRNLVANLSTLQQLDLSSMGLDNKVWTEMSDLGQLIRLNLSHNHITIINTDAMKRLPRLEYLDLNSNEIGSIPESVLEYQVNLEVLDVSFNKISKIPSSGFANQVSLKHLYMNHNQMSSFGFDALAQLSGLLTLDLSYNSLSNLPGSTFHGLTDLTHLDLSYNNLSFIDPDLFLNTGQIRQLNISNNNLTEAPVVSQLLQLRTIDLGYNRISNLNTSLLSELGELTTFAVPHNQITALPVKLLKNSENLRSIDLSYNSIPSLEESIFSGTTNIQYINLSHNLINDIRTVFSGLKHLELLDLSYNKIDKIMRGQFPHFVTDLNLRGNQILFITAHTFKSLNRIRTVDLSENKLTSLNRMDVEIAFNMGYRPVFNLELNPFVCDCRLGWLKDWTLGKLDTITLPTFYLNSALSCSSPFYTEQKTMNELTRAEFLCSYMNHCEESCMCCDYACYCKYVCPPSCLCYIGDSQLQVHHVRCDSAHLLTVPSELPEGATHLWLDGNNIPVLHRHEFLALKHVQVLYLNNSQITSIENSTFKGLKSVQVLYLQDNLLTSICTATFQGLDSLEELYLQNNQIYSLDTQALLLSPTLRLANLQDNSLGVVSLEDLELLANLSLDHGSGVKLYLSGNPWVCDVGFACGFLSLTHHHPGLVVDVTFIECAHTEDGHKASPGTPEHTLLTDVQPHLCASNQSSYVNASWLNLEGSSSNSDTYALIAICLVVMCSICLLIVTCVHRHLLQVILYSKFGLRLFKTSKPYEDIDRPYDAFISYSNKDEDFVVHQLAPRLENGKEKFKLCVHYRDFPVRGCLAETIVRSLEASKRTILVVSNHFLDSEWCRFEFQTAHQQVVSERHNRVILILLHNLDPVKVDENLRVYMKSRTFLKYEDPWFWEKLVFVMPDTRQRKTPLPSQLPSCIDSECAAHELCLSGQQQMRLYPSVNLLGSCSHCSIIHNGTYEIPVLDSPSAHYHLANSIDCGNITNSPYHYPDCSNQTNSAYHHQDCSNITNTVYHHPDNSNHSDSTYHHPDNSNITSSTYLHPDNSNITSSTYLHPDNSNITSSTYLHPDNSNITSPTRLHANSSNITNIAYHSDSSDCTACYHSGSIPSSCCHYEEVGPGSVPLDSTPHKQTGAPPPPVPSIPKEGFIPRQKLHTFQV